MKKALKVYDVYGEIILKGILASSKEEALETARMICNDDPIQAKSFSHAVESQATAELIK